MPIPACFCWTRFGTEAGQLIEQIFDRKEQERAANRGLFFWGIGNSIGPSIAELLIRTERPEVLFSPIKSTPRAVDSSPAAVVAWSSAETLSGEPFRLPASSLITSRHDPDAEREARYALVCFTPQPLLNTGCEDKIAPSDLRNLLTGRPVGASQVTAVVQRAETASVGTQRYSVCIRANLVSPYFIRLRDPLLLGKPDQDSDWGKTVRKVWEDRISGSSRMSVPKSARLF